MSLIYRKLLNFIFTDFTNYILLQLKKPEDCSVKANAKILLIICSIQTQIDNKALYIQTPDSTIDDADAVTYINAVKEAFGADQPAKYREFLDIMLDLRANRYVWFALKQSTHVRD